METISLCLPFDDTSCFRCCPPIRPAGYDHLLYTSSLKREFRENRSRFISGRSLNRPIAGFWCWALGYLDSRYKTVGCLLHPAQNRGVDLRFLTGYGSKCLREFCYEARQFARLSGKTQYFWIELARGLNSFYFSSYRANPLFHLLRWGPEVLEFVKNVADKNSWTATEAIWQFGFLLNADLEPRAWRLAVEIAFTTPMKADKVELTIENRFFHEVTRLWKEKMGEISSHDEGLPYVHSLDIDESLKDFIRFFLKIPKMSLSKALATGEALKEIVLECVRR